MGQTKTERGDAEGVDATSRSAGTRPSDAPYPRALVDRLLAVIAGLNADLDHDIVLERVCRACIDLLNADGAAFLVVGDDVARVTAGVGVPPAVLAVTLPPDNPTLLYLRTKSRRVIYDDFHVAAADYPDVVAAIGDLHTVAVTPVRARGQMVGALVVLYREIGRQLGPHETSLLDLLAGHGGAAIANALAFEDAVRRQVHEKAVIDAVADGVATLDNRGMVSGWNLAAAELTGRGAPEAFGRPLRFPVGTPAEPVEHRFGDRWVEIMATPLDDGQVVVLRDVSRQKALEVAKTMFVAATSHELKTPLTVIKSFADWLRDSGETVDGSRRQTAYDAVANSADELYQIVEKILLTARTEAGPIDLAPQAVDPARLARGTAAPFAVPDSLHELRLEIPDELPRIWADPHSVRTALGQLLENAIKYSPDGGAVVVTLRVTDRGEAVEFAVRDQGIGLAADETEYLFMPFYQGETRARSNVRGGVGLGLSIVRRLVEAQGGRVAAAGAPGQGARFSFTLPVATPDQDPLT